ncbi:hypothetical protein [Pelosinus sp. IPA-1]|uniref:hypothetical protein n=1 Tax=Pelosinus sp. IPA-1 TaxID=3029569 RepID=UPI0024362329|nr:hypothetical protein [Pelosinus sp. IPA-1]GMB01050.1 hypothetical protein PIPA1_38490 [Pelosinus sp. IPA-1]
MACKSYRPHKCGTCRYISNYPGTGKKVCYELQRDSNDKKVAVQVTENKKACNHFRIAEKIGRAV